MGFLSEQEFHETFGHPMKQLGPDDTPPFDFWPYVERIPPEDYQGHDCSQGIVDWAWETSDGKYQHVLLNTKGHKNVFMVIVLNNHAGNVAGHRLLNLSQEYGLR